MHCQHFQKKLTDKQVALARCSQTKTTQSCVQHKKGKTQCSSKISVTIQVPPPPPPPPQPCWEAVREDAKDTAEKRKKGKDSSNEMGNDMEAKLEEMFQDLKKQIERE